MTGGGQQPVTTTTQTNTPWGPVAGGFSQTIPIAEGMQASGTGYQPWTGDTMAPIDPMQQLGEANAESLAESNPNGVPALQSALNLADYMQQVQGITPGIQNAITGLGQAGAQYGDVYNTYGGIGSRAGDLYNTAINNQNPYLQNILQQINDQVSSGMSGSGRYGSGSYDKAIAAGEAPALLSDYEQRQQQAANALGIQTGAAGGQAGATQGQANIQSAIAGIYQTGLGQAGQFAQMVPTLQQAQYMPSQVLQQIGNYYTQRNQQQLNNTIGLWNAQQAYPWEQLSRENAIIGGAGGLGGTTVGTQQTQVPLGQRVLGGGLAGAGLGSAFGPIGTGVGAVGGALAGGFL